MWGARQGCSDRLEHVHRGHGQGRQGWYGRPLTSSLSPNSAAGTEAAAEATADVCFVGFLAFFARPARAMVAGAKSGTGSADARPLLLAGDMGGVSSRPRPLRLFAAERLPWPMAAEEPLREGPPLPGISMPGENCASRLARRADVAPVERGAATGSGGSAPGVSMPGENMPARLLRRFAMFPPPPSLLKDSVFDGAGASTASAAAASNCFAKLPLLGLGRCSGSEAVSGGAVSRFLANSNAPRLPARDTLLGPAVADTPSAAAAASNCFVKLPRLGVGFSGLVDGDDTVAAAAASNCLAMLPLPGLSRSSSVACMASKRLAMSTALVVRLRVSESAPATPVERRLLPSGDAESTSP